MQTIAISAEALLSLPHAVLIDLYNAESRRLAGNLSPHLVDETCKPAYIVGLFASLERRCQMMRDEASNEAKAKALPCIGVTERKPTNAELARDAMPLNGNRGFSLMR